MTAEQGVDLEALKAELEALGITVRKKLTWNGKLEALPFSIAPSGAVYWGPLRIKPEDWTALDIIRRHVAPVNPDGGTVRSAAGSSLVTMLNALFGEFVGQRDAIKGSSHEIQDTTIEGVWRAYDDWQKERAVLASCESTEGTKA